MAKISEDRVPLAAEDRFLIVSIKEALSLCPGATDAAALGEAIDAASPFLGSLTPLFDLRGLPQIYNDVDVFMDEVAGRGAHVLVNPRTAKQIDIEHYSQERGLQVLSVKGQNYNARSYGLSDLRHSHGNIGDPFYQLSMRVADEFTFDDVDNAPVIDDECLSYRPPTLEVLERVLSPKRLEELVLAEFPPRLWNGIRAAEFARSIRTFLPNGCSHAAHREFAGKTRYSGVEVAGVASW